MAKTGYNEDQILQNRVIDNRVPVFEQEICINAMRDEKISS